MLVCLCACVSLCVWMCVCVRVPVCVCVVGDGRRQPFIAGTCCQTTLLLGSEISVTGYDCTVGA